MVIVILVFGTIKYGHLKELIPNQSLTNPPGALYWYSSYVGFLDITMLFLALLIGVWTSLFGIVKDSILKGMVLLVAVVMITGLIYSLFPHVYYLGGDFSVFTYWITTAFYAYVGTWLLTTLVGTFCRRRMAGK